MSSKISDKEPGCYRVAGARGVLSALTGAGVTFGELHGLEDYPNQVGRDIDLVVSTNDAKLACETVVRYLDSNGWRVGVCYRPIGIDQVFASRKDDDSWVWLEIDLIHSHPFCWLGQILVPEGVALADLTQGDPCPLYPWAWFAKNLMLQLVAGNEEKFRKNYEEFCNREISEEKILGFARKMKLHGPTLAILAAGPDGTFSELRGIVKRKIFKSLIYPQRFFSSGFQFVPWCLRTWRLHFPKTGCAPVVNLFGRDQVRLAAFSESLCRMIEVDFVFPNVSLGKGKRLGRKGKTVIGAVRNLRGGGWERELRESNWLNLQIRLWSPEAADSLRNQQMITPNDLFWNVDEESSVENLSAGIVDAFFGNIGEIGK